MLAAIACLRYDMAIVLPKKDEDAAQLFAICGVTLIAITWLDAPHAFFVIPLALIILQYF
jgi:hypothetical protein